MKKLRIGLIKRDIDSEFLLNFSTESIERWIFAICSAYLASREFSPEWESRI